MAFKWLPGRQSKTDYQKLCLYSFRLGRWGFDAYLLKYKMGSILPWHRDSVNGKHWRVNIKIYGWAKFVCRGKEILKIRELIHIFRPDLYEHGLLVMRDTLKLSLGFAKYNKDGLQDSQPSASQ